MSDLEAVMERLLSDPLFRIGLARDPDGALAGYALSAEDRELLGVPLVSGAGHDRTVETRTTKSGMAGMFGPVMSAFGGASAHLENSGGHAIGSTPGESFGTAPGGDDVFGSAPESSSPLTHVASDGSTVGDAGSQTFGAAMPTESFGTLPSTASMGPAPSPLVTGLDHYSVRVDVDGDGTWDAHTVYARPDGGVDIQADMNNDGRSDFVAIDANRDGLIESADFDTDNDGIMDTRMYDDTGDGWMDRSESIPPAERQNFNPS
jgi:hypothetical protein